jgi:ketosteroid isomerase-like protein
MSNALDVGKKLVELCRKGKESEAVNTLYSQNIVSIEPQAGPSGAARQEGLKAIKAKAEWWEKNNEVRKREVEGPWPHGDRFIVRFKYDVTVKAGPMAGQSMSLDETGLYTVKDGKVVQEEFFYSMGG